MTDVVPHLATDWRKESVGSVVEATLWALLGGIFVGALTSFGQQVLPPSVSSIANSAGGWTAFAFLLVWRGRARPLLAGILGIVAFEALTEAYTIVSVLRGYPSGFFSIWVFVGIPAGALIGIAASFTRWATPLWKVLGVAVLLAVLVGESVYSYLFVLAHTSWIYWTIQLVAGVGMFITALAKNRLRAGQTLIAVIVALVGAAAFFAIYSFVL